MFSFDSPESPKRPYYIQLRDEWLVRTFANLLGLNNLGRFPIGLRKIKEGEVVFPYSALDRDIAEKIGITNAEQIYGSFDDDLLATKAIFRRTVPSARYVPEEFPSKFLESLIESGMILPGYVAFTLQDLLAAFELLKQEGYYDLRLKDPRASFGMSQVVINTTNDLIKALDSIDINYLNKYGLIIEVNLRHPKDPYGFPFAESGGWVNLRGGQIYSYVGQQYIGESIIPDKLATPTGKNPEINKIKEIPTYLGTSIMMMRGGPSDFDINHLNPLLANVLEYLIVLERHMHLLPIVCSRFNFDFLYGSYVQNGELSQPKMYLSEQSFRRGGASVPEFIAIKRLIENLKLQLSRASIKIFYLSQVQDADLEFIENFSRAHQKSDLYLRIKDPEYGDVLIIGYTEDEQ
jgi:hypothetical protein